MTTVAALRLALPIVMLLMLARMPPIVSRLPPAPELVSISTVPVLLKSLVVATVAPFSRLSVPRLLPSWVSALLLAGAEPSATRALAPVSDSSAPLPIAVTAPVSKPSSASPLRKYLPVKVVGAAGSTSSDACTVALPVKSIVPVFESPSTATVVAAVRLVLPISIVPLLPRAPVKATLLPPAPLVSIARTALGSSIVSESTATGSAVIETV